MLGTFRTLIKRVIMFIPGFGTAMYLLNWPFLTRKADKDLAYLAKLMAQYKKDGLPLWLTCFPEGTRYTEKKHADSLAFAKERGLVQMQVRAWLRCYIPTKTERETMYGLCSCSTILLRVRTGAACDTAPQGGYTAVRPLSL